MLDRLSQPHALEPCDALQKFDMWEGFIANGPMAVYVKCEEETNAEAAEGEILLSLDLWRNCVVQCLPFLFVTFELHPLRELH